MMQREYSGGRPVAGVAAALQESVTRVFFWMAFGVGVTALTAMGIASSDSLVDQIQSNSLLWLLIVFAQLGVVVAFGTLSQRVSSTALAALFLGFSALVGVTFAAVFLAYTKESIASTFFITAGTFAVVGLFGWTTKRDLTNVGALAFMGLIGVILASVVNIFLRSSTLTWIVTFVGIAVFVGLTAHDIQKMKQDAGALTLDGSDRERWALRWALNLYLDFINLFLFFLRIFGSRR